MMDPFAPAAVVDAVTRRPTPLLAVPVPMSWGREDWHGSTQAGVGQAGLLIGGQRRLLGDLVRAQPAVLGRWTRALFGDDLPVFCKFLRTNFAPFVHFGFAAPVERDELLGWLRREQQLMRQLFTSLAIAGAAEAATFMARYSAWAMNQSLGAPGGAGVVERWGSVALDDELLEGVAPFLRAGLTRDSLRRLLADIRANRARYCAVVNLVDLRAERGNILLSPAGVPHAINGLSEQTHPRDATFAPLTRLFATLRALADRGASEGELDAAVQAARLAEVRRANVHPPKNEAWFPIEMNGELVLVEPQQSSNVTYSYADFTTPFAWNEASGAFGFRKGDPQAGLSDDQLASFVDALDLRPLAPASARRRPVPIDAGPASRAAQLYRLVDEPLTWPYFTAYLLRLDGGGTFAGRAPDGAFQTLLVLQGKVLLRHPHLPEALELTPDQQPCAMIWATVQGGYTLEASARAEVLFTSVPTPVTSTPADVPTT